MVLLEDYNTLSYMALVCMYLLAWIQKSVVYHANSLLVELDFNRIRTV